MYMQRRQKSQERPQQQQQQTAAAPKGDTDDWTTNTGGVCSSTKAYASTMTVQCPRCYHNFKLIDYLFGEAVDQSSGSDFSLLAAAASLEWPEHSEHRVQQSNKGVQPSPHPQAIAPSTGLGHPQAPAQSEPLQAATDLGEPVPSTYQAPAETGVPSQHSTQACSDGIFLVSNKSSSNSWSPREKRADPPGRQTSDVKPIPAEAGFNTSAVATTAAAAAAAAAATPVTAAPSLESSLATEIVRNYQIVNTTIEQLERVIMDKTDRRIRKIASMSGCSIDLRSELPLGRFGITKNFCVLRSRTDSNIDCCRCMLSRQMGWNLVAKQTN